MPLSLQCFYPGEWQETWSENSILRLIKIHTRPYDLLSSAIGAEILLLTFVTGSKKLFDMSDSVRETITIYLSWVSIHVDDECCVSLIAMHFCIARWSRLAHSIFD
jgi:hypothetical protein